MNRYDEARKEFYKKSKIEAITNILGNAKSFIE